MSEITFGTVCSGIECASLDWEPLGWKPLWFSEIEQRACHLLKTRYPEVRNIGDMKGTLALIKDIKLKRPDVFAGGTPCQAFSSIGNNQGLLDPRAQLTKTFVEIANELSESWVLWENVPRVLSDKTNAFGHLLGGLCGSKSPIEPPSGHPWSRAGLVRGPTREVAWRVLDAQFFGLPQRRERVWVMASPRRSRGCVERALFDTEGCSWGARPSKKAGVQTYTGDRSSISRCLTAGFVRLEASVETFVNDSRGIRRLTALEYERIQGIPDGYTECIGRSYRYKAIGNSWPVPVVKWLGERIEREILESRA